MTSRPHDSALRWFAGIAVAVFLSVVLLYWLAPVTRRALYREHGVVEWATALLFLGGAVIGGDRLRRNSGRVARRPLAHPDLLADRHAG